MIGLFLSIPFVFHIPLTIWCSYRHFSIASLISGVDRLDVINSAVHQALLSADVWMNAYKPAAAYHRSVRLLYQISYNILNYKIINTQKYEPLVINMVKSRNYHFKNKTFIQWNTEPFRIYKSKYYYYIAQPSMLCHNYVKIWQINYGLC